MSRLATPLTVYACYLLIGVSYGQTILYVDGDAPGSAHDGSSWESAYRNPQDALTVATAGAEIRVAQGVYMPDGAYTPVGGVHVPGSGDREATFQLISDVGLYGGFAGYGEADPDDRNIELYTTILSGDLEEDDPPVLSDCCHFHAEPGCDDSACEATVCNAYSVCCRNPWSETCALYAADMCGVLCAQHDNSYHVVTGSYTDVTAVLDGFTVKGGNADSSYPHDRGGGMCNDSGSPTVTNCTFSGNLTGSAGRGAGMYNQAGSSPTVTNCAFIRNRAYVGGGMWNYSASPTLTDCTFDGNSASSGGGISNGGGSSPTVNNCTFSGNTAYHQGGGIGNGGSSPTVNNCTFTGNTAGAYGGGISNSGSSPTIANCNFSGNTADSRGGGVFNFGSSPTVSDCVFSANSAEVGGAMSDEWFSYPFIYRCTFVGNHARLGGGGLYSGDQSCPTAVLCKFFRNSSFMHGGGVFAEGLCDSSNTFVGCMFFGNNAGSGGGIYAAGFNSLHLTNCMFSANSAHTGGGIFLRYGATTVTNCSFAGNTASNGAAVANYFGSVAAIANSILWDGGEEISEYYASTVAVTYSDVQGGWAGDGNIDADPQFVAPNGPDGIPGTEDDDLRLRIGSPCTDAGDNTVVPQDVSDLDDDGDTSERTPLDLGGHTRFADDPCFGDSGVSDPPDYVRIVDIGAFELSSDRNENGIPDESEPDSDGDGAPDLCESCPFDPDKVEPGICGCGTPDVGDSDGDGVFDCVDQCPGADDAVFAPGCVDVIPTVSAWGLMVLLLSILVAAKIYSTRQTACEL